MNNFNKLALGLFGAVAFVSPAQAQEAEASKSGFWVNALLGAEKTDRGHTKEKFLFGLGGGYDEALGKARLGLEAEAAKTGASGCASQVDDDGDAFCYKNSYDLYAGVRAGFEVAPKLTVYAKGGYVGGLFKGSDEDGDIVGSEKTWLNGWRAGGGLERDFGGAFVKVEYRYSSYQQGLSKHQAVAGVGVRF